MIGVRIHVAGRARIEVAAGAREVRRSVSHLPTACRWTPCRPGLRPETRQVHLDDPAVAVLVLGEGRRAGDALAGNGRRSPRRAASSSRVVTGLLARGERRAGSATAAAMASDSRLQHVNSPRTSDCRSSLVLRPVRVLVLMNQLILFDIDGTLVVTGGAGQRAMNRAFRGRLRHRRRVRRHRPGRPDRHAASWPTRSRASA